MDLQFWTKRSQSSIYSINPQRCLTDERHDSGLSIRYKISAPAKMFTAASGVPGGTATANSNGTSGLNVLLHGDGGTSFTDFPNQAVQNNLMGVVVLAPNKNKFWGGGSGLNRTDGIITSHDPREKSKYLNN